MKSPPRKQPMRARKSADRQDLRRKFYQAVDESNLDLRQGVRQFRIMLGMTQPEFAHYCGVPTKTVAAFEQGVGNPTLATLEKLLKGSGLKLTLKLKG